MSGAVPEWLFVVCLAVALATGFVAGYEWCRWVRRARLRRQVRAARRRQAARESAARAGRAA